MISMTILDTSFFVLALVDLDGRFFAGRNVRADYYPKEKFDRFEYDAPIQ